MTIEVSRVDQTALKVDQASIVAIVALAAVFQLQWLIALLALVLIVGTILPSAGLFKLLYAQILRPLGLLKPNVVEEDRDQHLFAQGLGGIFLSASFISLAGLDQQFIGWTLAFLVAALAFVNLTVNFCLGCFLYLRLRRWSFFTRAFVKRVTSD